ncbi:MAG: two-component system sensor histidine kinase NtrB [Candidatus Zixiibacteriota bacterium]
MKKWLRTIIGIVVTLAILLMAFVFSKFSNDYVRRNLKTLHFSNGTSLSRTVIEGAKAVFEIQKSSEKQLQNKLLGISANFDELSDIEQIKQLENLGFSLVILTDLEGDVIYKTEVIDSEIFKWSENFLSISKPVYTGSREEYLFGIDLDFPGNKLPKGISIKRGNRILTVFADTKMEPKIQTGLGYLIRNVASESSISYIVLQNENGLVLASRGVNRVSKFASDDFLQKAIEKDEPMGRFEYYNGHQIYEVVTEFPKMGQFYGVLRIGLSLREYEAVLLAISLPFAVIFLLLFIMIALLVYNIVISRKLRKAEILTSGIIQKTGVIYIETDNNGKILQANETAKILFSEIDEELEKLPDIIGHNKWKKLQSSKDAKIISDVKLGERFMNIIAERLSQDDRYAGYYLMGFDTTELYDLRKRAESLHHLEGLSELTSTIAHDIRNPLNAISIASQKLDMIVDDNPKQKALLKTLNHEIHNLNKMVEEFLSLSAPLSIRKDKTNLSTFIRHLYEFAQMMSDSSNIKIVLFDDFNGYEAEIDREKLTRAIGNIIKNAIEATPEDGEIRISGKRDNESISFSVHNTGNPIPDKIISKLFKPIASRKSSGYGLGLFSAYRIIRTHHGDIDVQSGEDGTIFTIILPEEGR